MYKNVTEWLDETEIFASRFERLLADLDPPGEYRSSQLIKWLATAWRLGEQSAAQQIVDMFDDECDSLHEKGAGDTATALMGISLDVCMMFDLGEDS